MNRALPDRPGHPVFWISGRAGLWSSGVWLFDVALALAVFLRRPGRGRPVRGLRVIAAVTQDTG
jgi:hypothetical protein